jgi:tripartite-type tricarboxylate transporter receptor subunit TctC
MFKITLVLIASVSTALVVAFPVDAAEINGWLPGGVRPVTQVLIPMFEKTSGHNLLTGQIQMIFDAGPALPLIESGKIRALAVTSEWRNRNLPDVPTMIESGFPGFVTRYWNGVVAPAGTPDVIVNKLSAAINEGLKSPDMQASLAKIGLEPTIVSPQEFAALIAAETQKWATVVKATGIKVD